MVRAEQLPVCYRDKRNVSANFKVGTGLDLGSAVARKCGRLISPLPTGSNTLPSLPERRGSTSEAADGAVEPG